MGDIDAELLTSLALAVAEAQRATALAQEALDFRRRERARIGDEQNRMCDEAYSQLEGMRAQLERARYALLLAARPGGVTRAILDQALSGWDRMAASRDALMKAAAEGRGP